MKGEIVGTMPGRHGCTTRGVSILFIDIQKGKVKKQCQNCGETVQKVR